MISAAVADIVVAVEDRSARGIAAAIGRMVTAGALATDTRLPTVRALSRGLGVSPTTVSEAWQTLAAVGAIEARGRLGTFVRQPVGRGGPRRYRRVTEGPGHFALDLSTGTPDPSLLPDLGRIVAMVSRQSLTSSYLDHPVLPQLEEALRAEWPFEPEQLTVVDGAMDALDRVAQVVLRLGDRVVVEHPTFPPLLDLLEQLGVEMIAVDVDAEGMSVDGFRDALVKRPTAVFLQPRAHNPTGVSMTARRRDALGALMANSTEIIVEDDHSGGIASDTVVSFGALLGDRTVHIRSFSKSHGPDLRLAAIAGAGDVITAVANRRLLGPGWSSRILQAVLVELLADPSTATVLEHARTRYARRRSMVTTVLGDRNVPFTGGDGINLWMRVADERSAMMTLAARGIGVAPGEPFMVRPDDPSLRITVGLLNGSDDDVMTTAEQLADAAGFTPRRGQR
ncbi:MAG: aminotransferase class I/II-fold pyridoxal phosphate-dependent enzyme [Ilumatobacteraceae bacterium]